MSIIDDIRLAARRGNRNENSSGVVVSIQEGFATVRLDGAKSAIKVLYSGEPPVARGSRVVLRRDPRTTQYTIISTDFAMQRPDATSSAGGIVYEDTADIVFVVDDPTVSAALTNVGIAGTYTKVTTDTKGRVTSGSSLSSSDVPPLDASKIASGVLDPARIPPGLMTGFSATGDTGTPQLISDGDTLKVSGGVGLTSVAYAPDTVEINLDSPVDETLGGTGQTTYADGDLLYASNSNTLSRRAIGATGQVLTVVGGVPTWTNPIGGQNSRAEVRYVVARNVAGTLVSSFVWTTLPLNTIRSDPGSLVSISSNQMTLSAGHYSINSIAQVYFPSAGYCKLRLRNITSETSVESANAYYPVGGFHTGLVGTFYSNGTDQFALQIVSNVNNTSVGLRSNNAIFGDEVYITLLLEKLS